ncbi:hypothetical protein [Rhodococcus sp. 1R11]|uniref:hypothetical protein n=1 Tax=Rhodococcus sp. 1R11 TaxID=2559614 RepID=UPI001ADC05F6|nr:hypothetical protein [Rhodococcus sp. 1R11]
MKSREARSVVMIVVGAVLALFFWDQHMFWFQGGPIGCVLVVLAMLDLWDSRRGTPKKGATRGTARRHRRNRGFERCIRA